MLVTHQYLVSPTKSMAPVLDIIFPGILQPRVELHSRPQLVGSFFFFSPPPLMLFAHSSLALTAKEAGQATQCCPVKISGNPRPEIQQSHKTPQGMGE